MPRSIVIPNQPEALDYVRIGAQLESDATPKQCATFAQRYGTSTDPALRTLAAFALHTALAKARRLEGRIPEATLHESHADRIYLTEVQRDNRW